MTETSVGGAETDYSATLFLPETEFPMRAGLPEREPTWLKRWENMDIYALQRAQAKDRPLFTLHDGPPYANGNIHIGHALNKILKDLVSRSKQMLGYNSAYVPGWDCHGLPIEWKIEESYRAKGKDKNEVPVVEFRQECRTFASQWVDIQREEFKRLGVLGEWDNPYLTMSFDAEAQIAREIMKVAASGQLYRGSKPVMWSVVERTALAEAEIEYADYESDTIWVKFPVVSVDSVMLNEPPVAGAGAAADAKLESLVERTINLKKALEGANVVIWTTTPWTIPANRAISFSSRVEYGLYEVTEAPAENWAKVGEKYILADKLAAETFAKAKVTGSKKLADVTADDLKQITVAHPLNPVSPEVFRVGSGYGGGFYGFSDWGKKFFSNLANEVVEDGKGRGHSVEFDLRPPYSFPVPLLDGDHVTDDTGTGFVHTAPSHGLDDFDIWLKSGRMLTERGIDTQIPFPVADDGFYTKDAPGFEGARVIDDNGKKGDANQRVITALAERGAMLARGRVKHQYPHSWRSKKPVIYRNTPQWFVYMDRDILGAKGDTLRHRALKAIDATKFYPAAGQNRLRSMIADRPDWVLSRQRAWGVPITVFVHKETGEVLKDEEVNHRIAQSFEEEGADAWYKPGAAQRFLGSAHKADDYEMVMDILDVWFDSGSTHAFVLRNKQKWPHLKFPASMYLEGSDQHRGWFHSSLLESCATNGHAPYESVLTHGFTLDGEGKKMSKSLGNTVAPQDVIKQYGADILRLWVASSDYSDDLRIGKEIINSTVDNYRKLRNSIRWLIGNLAHYKPEERVAFAEMPELERLILSRLSQVGETVRAAYDTYDYKRIVAVLSNFMNIDLSAFYFDIRKDALYCDPISSTKRRASLTVLDEVFEALTAWLAPILVFTMEEAWLERHPGTTESVHLRLFPDLPAEWRDTALEAKWEKIRAVRRVVTGALEIERKNKVIGSSLEAAPVVAVSAAELFEAVKDVDFAEIAITSFITLVKMDGPADAFRLDEQPGVAVVFEKASGKQCARSRRFFADVGADPAYPDLSARDAQAMRERAAAGL